MEEIIKTEKLTYTYSEDDSSSFALCDVDISIKKGEFLAILGHNGSGKSTFAKHLNGILLPSGGVVYAVGMDTRDESLIWEIRRHIGMVFQNPDNQIVATVVEEDVAFAPENMGVPTEEIRRRVDDALRVVGMEKYLKHAPHMLSGGQKQRIAIAGVLAMMPDVIVLDEPTAMLDPIGRRDVLNTLLQLNKTQNMTIVLITHHMDEAAMAERIIVMNDGRCALSGTPKEVFSQGEKLREMSLGVPQSVEIIDELRALCPELKSVPLTVEDCCDEIERFLKI